MTRRDLLEYGVAAGALSLPTASLASPRGDQERYWEGVRRAFPVRSGPMDFVNSGGGACPAATLDILAKYQRMAAAGGEDGDPALASIKESGSSPAIRAMMAETFGCGADEIALTRNAMEGLAIGLLGIDLKPGDEILTTRADYDSCIQLLRQREAREGIRLTLIDVPMPASTDDDVLGAFESACSARTRVILLCHMYNKNGQILPVRRIADMARRRGIMTVVDGAQTVGHIDFRLSDLGCDVFATSLHKWFYAPRGTGFVYIRREAIVKVWPIWASWSGKSPASIEKYEEFGTVSKAVSAALPSVFAFNRQIGAARKEQRLRQLRDLWLDPVLRSGRTTLLTDRDPARSCAITAFKVDGVDPDTLARTLREQHDMVIGTINLTDNPGFRGNYLAVDLTNTPEQLSQFADAFRSAIAGGARASLTLHD